MTRPRADPIGQLPALDRDRALAEQFVERTRARVAGTHTPPPLRRIKKPSLRGRRRHLVVGDSHSHPDDPNHRFEALGRMIADRAPDVVVDIGDSADMASLFGYEQGSKGPLFEGHRYWRDIDAYLDARERLHRGMGNAKPRLVKTEGNHEQRIERFLLSEPRMRGVVGPHNLMDAEFGWELYPYGEIVDVDGILYSHAFRSPTNGREIAGVMPTRAMVMQLPGSASRVQGHSHIFQLYETCDVGGRRDHGRKITAIHAGCYFDPGSNAHRWAGYSVSRWRPGILELEVEGGQILSFSWTDYHRVHALYG